MIEKKKLAVFDFCETLVDFQTADAFVDYVRISKSSAGIKVKKQIHSLLKRYGIIDCFSRHYPKSSINKRIVLWQLRGLLRNELESYAELYYEEKIRPHFIGPVISELQRLKSEGYEIVVASGGYDIYIKYFAEEFSIDKVIATQIKFIGGVCLGRIQNKDCLYEEKRRLLEEFCPRAQYEQVIAFSDSISDVPMLDWADIAIVVRRKDRVRWTTDYFELVW